MDVREPVPRAERAQPRFEALQRLGGLKTSADPRRACQEAARVLASPGCGFLYALVYLLESEPPRLVASSGLARRRARQLQATAWPLLDAARTGAIIRVDSILGPALVAPIVGPGPVRTVAAAVVLGLPEGFELDPDLVAFVHVATGQIGASLAGTQAYLDALTRAEESNRLQAQMARTVELEKLKSEFLRLASHELRGPLAVVRGYLDMVVGGTFGDMAPPMDAVMTIVAAKVDEMNRLVEQMLETARLEENRLLLSSTEFDLRQVVRESANALMPLAQSTHSFRFKLGPDPVLVLADRTRIAGVVTNVLDNAVKYSPAGGEITITCDSDPETESAMVVVEDQGIGIDEADMSRLFTRFGRIVNSDNSHIPGTGLGLYLAREIARMHSGDIRITSRRSEGTKVAISLPLSAPATPVDAGAGASLLVQ
jgi:signal transduction histidine kinase